MKRWFTLLAVGTLMASVAGAQAPGSLPGFTVRLTPKYESIVGGNSMRINVSFSGAAPAGSSSVHYVSTTDTVVPVNWPSGTTDFSTYYQSAGVDSPVAVNAQFLTTITASAAFFGTSTSFSLVPADVAKVGFVRNSLNPYESTKGVVILNGEAGPSGRTVTLTSDDSAIVVPSTVTVPAYARRVEFDVSNFDTGLNSGKATVTAQIGKGPSASSTISYNDLRQVSITPSRTSIVGGNQLGFIAAINTVEPGDSALGFNWSGTATGSFPNLVPIAKGRRTVGFSVVPDGVDSAKTLTVTGVNNTAPYPTASVQVLPATLTSVTMNPTYGGIRGTGTVTLDGFAGPSGVDILLDSAAIHASFPATVTIPYNQRSANFTYTSSNTDSDEVVNLMAYQGSTMVTTTGTVRRAAADVLVPSVTSSSGGRVTFTLRLKGAAGPGGVSFSVTSSDPSVRVPSTVSVLPGKAAAAFYGTVTSTGTPTPVTITATGPTGVGSAGTTITVN